MAKGSKLQRAISYFREAEVDEARVAFQLVKEIIEERLGIAQGTVKATVKRRARKPKGEPPVIVLDAEKAVAAS